MDLVLSSSIGSIIAIIHGFLGWFYVVYYLIFIKNRG